ncbi:MAG: biopolymer transporter ExbD [Chromatiales bacterium]|jgi:biopolymer transport protein ExbD
MQLGQTRKPRRLISLTPLIDVVFILLVFFMISSNFMEWRHLSLHSVNEGKSRSVEHKTVLLTISPQTIHYNGRELDTPGLQQELQQQMLDHPDMQILLKPDRQVALQRLVEVMDKLEAAGAAAVTLIQ